ncbi:MAG: YbaN family protein [Spirochaetales bacterium]|jgi:uncharacterized protein|nr:YbaN family protein [Spirochaetales bacterium]
MHKHRIGTKKVLLIILGFLSLSLGIVGIFLPLLPTTVFLLISAWCWARSSERFYKWLMNNRWLGSYIRNYSEGKGITARQKIFTFTLLWVGIGATAIFAVSALWLKLVLFGIACGVTIHLGMLRTLPGKQVPESEGEG